MAKFNENYVNEKKMSEEHARSIGMSLQGLLSDDDFQKLQKEFHSNNPSGQPYWKYCLDHIDVTYGKKIWE